MSFVKKLPHKGTVLAVVWLGLTLSLIAWWWYLGLTHVEGDERLRRMFIWEGVFLFLVLFLGGAGLIYLSYTHHRRHERLRTFFATFAHDLKTSISRLRLQGELIEESSLGSDPKVKTILKNIQKLDLQLENSLWLAQIDSDHLLIQNTRLSEVMERLRNEFSETGFEINQDAQLMVDRRAFTVVLRNLFQNSRLHGEAETIRLRVSAVNPQLIRLEVSDDGKGLQAPVDRLGREILSLSNEKSNGLGLYLCRRLMERMDGSLQFENTPRFTNVIIAKGSLI